MNVLVIGNGAREHALAWKISQSPKVQRMFVAPGNAGTARIAHNLNISAGDIRGLVEAARANRIDLVMVGPEAPLTAGIVDELGRAGIPAFGPSKAAAEIEGSKVFAKELMRRYGIPTAASAEFDSFEKAAAYVRSQPVPMVIKADGLAAGKGVIIAATHDEALRALSEIMQKKAFGSAGDRVLIEECLMGREASLLAFTDGESVVPMVPACDYKRALDGDRGPNTGGMGSYAPSEFFTEALKREVIETIMKPTVKAMAREGRPYRGVLYAGLMVTDRGPKILEFNARFGDPETQAILPLLRTDLVEIMEAVIGGELGRLTVEWSDGACVGIVLASGGYPGSYRTGFPIEGLDRIEKDVLVFHAGTATDGTGRVVTSGGRVLTVTATGRTIAEARARAYANVDRVGFEGCHYRRDIAMIKSP